MTDSFSLIDILSKRNETTKERFMIDSQTLKHACDNNGRIDAAFI